MAANYEVGVGEGRLSKKLDEVTAAPQCYLITVALGFPLRRGGYGGGSLGPSWLISADLCVRMASRRWAASLDSCSNSLVAVVLSWAKACLSMGGLPSSPDCDDLVLLRVSPGRYAERAVARSIAVCERRPEGCLHSQRGCTPSTLRPIPL